jgi:hypothetical protein
MAVESKILFEKLDKKITHRLGQLDHRHGVEATPVVTG